MRRLLPLCLLALAAWPGAAAAQDPGELLPPLVYEGAPTTIARGEPLAFAVRTAAPAGTVTIRVSGMDETDDEGALGGGPGMSVDAHAAPEGDPTLHVWRPPAEFLARQRPGTYFWQAYIDGPTADSAEEAIGDVQSFQVLQPAVARGSGRLYPKFGHRGRDRFYVSSADFPAEVSGPRFAVVAGRAAKRWGLKRLRWTSAAAGRRDGYNVAGFSDRVPKAALGVQTDYIARKVRRVFSCRGGQCIYRDTAVGGRQVVEQDLALRADVNWQQGPAYPALDQVDLESVLIHELAHYAGNNRHARRCANSPLVEALGDGEWWRGTRDAWFFGCDGKASAAASAAFAPTAEPRPILRRVVYVD